MTTAQATPTLPAHVPSPVEPLPNQLLTALGQHRMATAGRQRSRQPALAGPAWLCWYPVFPRFLFVLTGGSRQVLDNRNSDLQAMTAQHPLVATMARTVPLGAAVLDDLEAQRPTGDAWVPLGGGESRPWTEL